MSRMINIAILSILFLFSSKIQSVIAQGNGGLSNIEKIRLHTDRDLYLAGETVFFRAWYMLSNHEKQQLLSKVLYVELFFDGKAVVRKKFALGEEGAEGSFIIPETANPGIYFLRAYTKWQRNLPANKVFARFLSVVNPGLPLPRDGHSDPKPQVHFSELPSNNDTIRNIAFYWENIPSDAPDSLWLTDTLNNSIKGFKLFENGLGQFSLKSTDALKYFVKIVYRVGDTVFFSVPNVVDINQSLVSSDDFNKPQTIQISLKTSKSKLKPREGFQLLFDAPLPENLQPQDLSFSIVKKGTIDFSNYLLPKFALKNEQFFRFFQESSLSFSPELNMQIVLAKHFYNKEVIGAGKSIFSTGHTMQDEHFLPETRDVSLEGIVQDKSNKKPVAGAEVFVSVLSDTAQVHILQTDEKGRFVFSLNHLNNVQDIYLGLMNNPDNRLECLIKTDFSNHFDLFKEIALSMDTSHRELLTEMLVNAEAERVFLDFLEKQPKSKKHLPSGFSNAPISIKLKDFIALPTLEEVFNELIPAVRVKKQKDNYRLSVFDPKQNLILSDPLVLIDNIPVGNLNELMKISPEQVKQIDVINTTYLYGENTLWGLILVTTHTDNFAGLEMSHGSQFFQYETITPPVDFPAVSQPIPQHIPIFRNTVHWIPSFEKTDKPIEIPLIAPDHLSEYEVLVRGYTADGRAIFGRTGFVVE